MTSAYVRHTCPVPGCEWRHDHHLRTLDAQVSPEAFMVLVEQDHAELETILRHHLAAHFLPDPDGVGVVTDRPLVERLSHPDGAQAVDLGEDVEAMVMLTRDGHAQAIGRSTTDPMVLVDALRRCAESLEAHLRDGGQG